jgi:hypothetical protein
MNLCRNGHDKDKIGVDKQGQCSECRRTQNRERARVRRRSQGKPVIGKDVCRNGIHPKTELGPCRECLKANRKRYKKSRTDRGLRLPPSRDTYRQAPDGWESDYGPVPDRVPNQEWYDEVIVRRALLGYSTGRIPHRLEQIDIVNGMTPGMTAPWIAQWCGVEPKTVSEWVEKYRVREEAV